MVDREKLELEKKTEWYMEIFHQPEHGLSHKLLSLLVELINQCLTVLTFTV